MLNYLLPPLIFLVVITTCLCKFAIFNKIVCILYSIAALILFAVKFDPTSHAFIFGVGLWIYSAPAMAEDTRESELFFIEGKLYELLYGDHPIIGVIAGTICIVVLAALYAVMEQIFPIAGPAVGLIGCIVMIPVNIIGLIRYIRSEY